MNKDAQAMSQQTAAEQRGMQSAELSNAMVRIYKEQFGRGPTKSHAVFAGPDLLVCTLEVVANPPIPTGSMHGSDAASAIWRVTHCANGTCRLMLILHVRQHKRRGTGIEVLLEQDRIVPGQPHNRNCRRCRQSAQVRHGVR